MPISVDEYADEDDNVMFRAIKLQKWTEVSDLINSEEGEKLAREVDKYGNTPLHAALGYKAPDATVIIPLLKLYPGACQIHGTDDWLPLHVAAMWGASADAVEVIIRLYPQALDDAASGGIKGRTPRHFSARFPHLKELLERSSAEWITLIDAEKNAS